MAPVLWFIWSEPHVLVFFGEVLCLAALKPGPALVEAPCKKPSSPFMRTVQYCLISQNDMDPT